MTRSVQSQPEEALQQQQQEQQEQQEQEEQQQQEQEQEQQQEEDEEELQDGDVSSLPPEALAVPDSLASAYLHTKKVSAYLIGRQIGEGSFARVAEALHLVSGELAAVKIIDKQKAVNDPYVCRNLRREGRILQRLRHPNVVQLLEVLETDNSYYLVSELCTGGDLLSFVTRRGRLGEELARGFLRQILSAVAYIHKLGIVHRDLKIENILLTSDSKVKIIDFGLSTMLKSVRSSDGKLLYQLCKTQCGSPAYAAPEVLARQPYGAAVDVWSIGVNLFAMLSGHLPFSTKPYSIKALHEKMINRQMHPLPKSTSDSCRDLLNRLLEPLPEKRISITEALQHPWMRRRAVNSEPASQLQLPTAASDLRQEVLQRCVDSLGVTTEEVAHKVLHNVASSCLATYSLLLVRARRYCRQHRLSFDDNEEADANAVPLVEANDDCGSSVGVGSCSSSCCSGPSRAASDTKVVRLQRLQQQQSRLLADRPAVAVANPLSTPRPESRQQQQQQQKQQRISSVLDLRVTRDRTTLYGTQQLPHIHQNKGADSSRQPGGNRRSSDIGSAVQRHAPLRLKSTDSDASMAATGRLATDRRLSVDSRRLATRQ